jgi:hypothetical protein
MDTLQSVALAAGLAWGSGIRLYAVLFLAGLMARLGYVELPPALGLLTHPAVLGASGFMFFIEFFADKVPGFDTLWDAAHTFIRIPAGALLAALALADRGSGADPRRRDPRWHPRLRGASHQGRQPAAHQHLARAVLQLERLSRRGKPAARRMWTAFTHPLAFLAGLAIFLLAALWLLLPKIWRGLRVVWRRMQTALSRQRPWGGFASPGTGVRSTFRVIDTST